MQATGGGERAAVERIRRLLPPPPAGEVWIADDAAVVAAPPGCLLLATDLVVEGVHVDLSVETLDDLGWAALARSISDMAAMGARPRHAVVAVAGPPTTDLESLYRGLGACASQFECPIVGGDLSGGPVLTVAVAVTGTVAGGEPVLRSGAQPGDGIFVTAPLGAAAAARRAGAPRRPWPRVEEGDAVRRVGATAMIDVSDGLAVDLDRLAAASGVGVALETVPVAEGATLDDALGGGDDYELLFCAPGSASPHGTWIGRCTADAAERTLDGDPLAVTGWEHPWY